MTRIINIFALTFLLACNAFAEDFSKNPYIIEINKKLAETTNVKVKFRQVFNAEAETGTIYFSKNKGLFIKYETKPISILVNKTSVVYYDSRLNQKSQIPTKESASEIFIKTLEISDRDFDIKKVEKIDGVIKIVATSKKNQSEGEFTMYFTEDCILRRVDITSLDGSETARTDLYSHEYEKISSERFKAINIEKAEI